MIPCKKPLRRAPLEEIPKGTLRVVSVFTPQRVYLMSVLRLPEPARPQGSVRRKLVGLSIWSTLNVLASS